MSAVARAPQGVSKPLTGEARVLALLRARPGHYVADLYTRAGCMVHSRVTALRKRGYQIECHRFGQGDYRYRLLGEPARDGLKEKEA